MKRTLFFGIAHYLSHDIWHCDLTEASFWRRRTVMFLRITVLLVRNFNSNRCQLWASALTYYSLFSLVPMIALGLGIAKGFGLDRQLTHYVKEQLYNNPDVAKYLLDFSSRMLEKTSYGLVAGVGVLLLLFSVIKMIGNIEKAFNFIYGVRNNRPFILKISYYLSILLICPVLLIAAGSATAMVTNAVTALAAQYDFFPLKYGAKFIPFPIVWIVLALIYKFLPNTRVRFRAALTGAVVAGTLYQFLQMGFLSLQFALSKYNAVYGSFSALPLFMIYLQFSWLIVLFGIQISFLCQNVDNIDAEPGGTRLSNRYRTVLCLAFAGISVRRLIAHEPPASAAEYAKEFRLPLRIAHDILHTLVEARVLIPAMYDGRGAGYVPLLPPEEMTAAEVIRRCDATGHGEPPALSGRLALELEKRFDGFMDKLAESPLNFRLDSLNYRGK